MAENATLSAEPKSAAGKGVARAARRAGVVPGIIYGAKKDPEMITVGAQELTQALNNPGFFATLYDLKLGKGKQSVLPRDVQYDPVTDRPLHIDFLRVARDTEVTVQVPVVFLNEEESVGLRRGGVLNVVRYEIEVVCRADAIPPQIDVDLAGLDIGDSVHISTVDLPDGVAPTISDRDFTIATIAAPSVVQEEEDEEEGEELEEGEEGAEETTEAEGDQE